MKKKWKYLIIGMLMLSFLLVPKAKISATEPEFKKIDVNEADDISNASGGMNCAVEYLTIQEDDVGDSQVFYYTFTLDQPAFVRFEECAKVFECNFNGDVEISLSRNKVFTDALAKEWANGTLIKYDMLLDEGTYYIKVNVINKSKEKKYFLDEPTNILSVYAEYLEGRQAGMGLSKKKAIKMTTGQEANSQLSFYSREKYFSINVDRTSDIIFQCSNKTKSGWDDYVTDDEVYWKVFTSKGEELKCVQTNGGWSSPSGDRTDKNYITFQLSGLKPGTYYVTVANKAKVKNAKAMYEAQCTPIVLYSPSIKEVKRTSKTTATVVLKNKIKEATGYEVAYSTNKDMSNAKIVRLSKNTKLNASLKKLKSNKTYYVQVRSYFKAADGTIYYSRYGKRIKL